MSRHRDVRNIKSYDDDYSDEEDMSDYGVSPASPTQAQYLYQRNRRSRGNSFGTLLEREMAQQKEEKLAYECMEQVYAVLGEGNWDEEEVWEAVHHADFDAERAVAMLLERPGQGSKGEEGGDDLFQLEMEGQKGIRSRRSFSSKSASVEREETPASSKTTKEEGEDEEEEEPTSFRTTHSASRFASLIPSNDEEVEEEEEEANAEEEEEVVFRSSHPSSRFAFNINAMEEGDEDDDGEDEEAEEPQISIRSTHPSSHFAVQIEPDEAVTVAEEEEEEDKRSIRSAHPSSRFASIVTPMEEEEKEETEEKEDEEGQDEQQWSRPQHVSSRFALQLEPDKEEEMEKEQEETVEKRDKKDTIEEVEQEQLHILPSSRNSRLFPSYSFFSDNPDATPSTLALNIGSLSPSTFLSSSLSEITSSFSFTPTYPSIHDIVPFAFDQPSPDDVVFNKRKQAFKQKKERIEQQKQPAPVLDKATTITITVPAASSPQPSSSLTKAVQELSLEEQRQGEAAESGSPSKKKTVQVPQRSVARKKEVLKMVEESKHVAGKKEHLNMVVIGHVDAGKSTIMGHLLYQLGAVSDRLMHRYERDSKNIGKSSFSFAWVLDEHEEERNRGVTMDVAVTNFETETKVITLLDAPGHRDFVPNMISGAAQADVAVLVVNAAGGEFEAGFDEDGQTKEHALLARSLGVTQLIVAVNQLDQVDWSQDRFNLIQERMSNFLKQAGYNLKNVNYVPISGLKGENLVKRSEPRLTAWYSGPTLVERIDSFRPAPRLIEKPFRLCITDIYKHIVLGTTVAGKIETGVLAVGDKLLLMPLNEVCTVKGINVHQNPVPFALAGANVDIGVQGLDATAFRIGNILCDPEHPVRVCTRFKAQIIVFPLDIPITRGYHVLLHSQSLHEPAFITKLLCVVDQNTGAVKKRRPRCLTEKMTALVEITTVSPICVELYRDFKQLGRMTLRVKGKTIAAGIITQVLKDNPK